MWHPNVYPSGLVCISILHPPEEDKYGYEDAGERWMPVHTPHTILLSVISMVRPRTPNPQHPRPEFVGWWVYRIVCSFVRSFGVCFCTHTNPLFRPPSLCLELNSYLLGIYVICAHSSYPPPTTNQQQTPTQHVNGATTTLATNDKSSV